MKYLQPDCILGDHKRQYCPPSPRWILSSLSWDRREAVELCRALILCPMSHMQSLSPLRPSTRNLVGPSAQTGDQITIYGCQHFKYNENTKTCPDLLSHSPPCACTQTSTIGKCCSASLKLIRTSRAWENNCSTSLSSTAEVHCAPSSTYGPLFFGEGQLEAAPSISRTFPQWDWELN